MRTELSNEQIMARRGVMDSMLCMGKQHYEGPCWEEVGKFGGRESMASSVVDSGMENGNKRSWEG